MRLWRILIFACLLVPACATSVQRGAQHPPHERRIATGRAVFFVGEDSVAPVACYDTTERGYRTCTALLHEGDVVQAGAHRAALGARVRYLHCDVCSDVDAFLVARGSFSGEDLFLATWPPEVDFDIRLVEWRDEPPEVGDGLLQTLGNLASEYYARPADTWHQPCANGAERVDPDSVEVTQRVDVDLNADGEIDQLYAARAPPVDSEACTENWSALVLVTGGTMSETTVLAETNDAMFRVRGTFELDGEPPRELIYETGYEGLYTMIGRIDRGSLDGLGGDGCDP